MQSSPARNAPAGLAEQLAAARQWWALAGVDQAFLDEPQAWLAPPAPPESGPAPQAAVPQRPAEPAPPAFTAEQLPHELPAFQEWWCQGEWPIALPPHRRIAPRGVENAPLMVVVPMPEEDDETQLLEGDQGVLVANILRALGLSTGDAYLASALPVTMTLPDWHGLAAQGLGTVLRHHIALARPRRVLLLGGALAQLVELDPGRALHEAEIGDRPVPLCLGHAAEHLLAQPRQRARLWHRLLEWTASE